MSVNRIMVLGYVSSDVKHSPEHGVTNFSIATNESYKDKNGERKESTQFHRIVVFGKLAEVCAQYLAKGRQAFVEGKIQYRTYDDKNGNKQTSTEIVASTVQFLGGKDEEKRPALETADIPF